MKTQTDIMPEPGSKEKRQNFPAGLTKPVVPAFFGSF